MKKSIYEICVFGMLGALMYASKALMNALPNIHLIGLFITAITLVYRKKALFPIYIFVLLTGIFEGFGLWWIPYLYIWTVLWGALMLLPRGVHPVFPIIICALHGFLFGVLYAPAQALMFGFTFKGTLSWIASGLPFDVIHGISNLVCGALLLVPLTKLLRYGQKMAEK